MFALAWGFWSRIPALAQRWPAARAAALVALVGAGGYALLSGLSVPAQRAFLMLAVAMTALFFLRAAASSHILALALLTVLIIDPKAPLLVGFWLSFGAVAAILSQRRWALARAPTAWPDDRFAVEHHLALLPLLLLFFQRFPLLSPLANLIAIPWVGCTVLPLTLLAVLAGWIGPCAGPVAGRRGADHGRALADSALAGSVAGHGVVQAGATLVGAGVRPAGCGATVGASRPAGSLAGAAAVSAPVVATRRHAALWWGLVYPVGCGTGAGGGGADPASCTGLRHRAAIGRNAGCRSGCDRALSTPARVIKLDMLIVSHADKQHTGGVRSLREQMPVGRILTSSLEQTPIDGAELCRVGQDWEWDGVRFRLLHPPATGFVDDEASCVLQVIGSAGRVLLPGDIETRAETALTAIHGAELVAEVLVAPHQGRRNLSVPAFLAAVQPRYILFSTGYRNRFGYPRPETVARYRATGATLLDASTKGTHLPAGAGSAIGAGAIPTRPPSLLDRALTGASPRQIR